jgi:hypothetical protein
MTEEQTPLDTMLNELEKLLKPEGDIHECIRHLKDTMKVFYKYMREVKEVMDAQAQ